MDKLDFFAELNEPVKRPPSQSLVPLHKKKLSLPPPLPTSFQQHSPQLNCYHQSQHNCIWERYSHSQQEMVVPVRPPAKAYKFKLDAFQKKAVRCIEADESVLVCAHTSAGKTAVAQYAISLSFSQNSRCIYTSPIKALSNQKYRDLKEEFGDVGLVTGDVTQNPSSSCLVMTTEILRSMIYRGSEVVRQVKWVIFDECHYMRDSERGVVWEECIEMLPKAVKLLFLSATIANATEFSKWVCTIKNQPCSVVYTDYRPVPLEHYIFPAGADGISLVVDEKSRFLEDNFQKAIEGISEGVPVVGLDRKGRKGGEGSDLQKVLKLLVKKDFNPVIVFSFSKKDVEGYAQGMQMADFLQLPEKERTKDIFRSAIEVLSQQDRKLPQIETIRPMLERGIGIHHGGLLPLIKEITELLFQEGLVKILFSTQTFSMGLNMPARTVVFTSIRKFDGQNFRWMRGGEYIQMSGRAGRRGKDKKGISVIMLDEKMEPDIAKQILKGKSDPLESAFHINYNMLLSSIRLQDTDPQQIIKLSFLQFQTQSKVPCIKKDIKQLQNKADSFSIKDEEQLTELLEIHTHNQTLKAKLHSIVFQPTIILPYLRIGRLVRIKHREIDWKWGLVVNWSSRKSRKREDKTKDYIIDIVVHVKPPKKGVDPRPADLSEEGVIMVIPFVLQAIFELSVLVVALPQNVTSPQSKILIKDTLRDLEKKHPFPPLLHFQTEDMESKGLQTQIQQYHHRLQHHFNQQPGAIQQMKLLEEKVGVINTINQLLQQITTSQEPILGDQMRNMRRVLLRKDFLDSNGIVTLKGTVACELGSCDELLLTELLFSGFFSEYSAGEVAALLSTVVHDEKAATDKKFIKNPVLAKGIERIRASAHEMFKVYAECRLDLDQEQYNEKIKQQLVQVTLQWCKGANFLSISKMTDAFEGSIVRTLKRLDELLKQLEKGASIMGNLQLSSKFKEGQRLLERGIVFTASLYL